MVVVEGAGSCRASLRRWYDATVWVDTPEHVGRRRVLAPRDRLRTVRRRLDRPRGRRDGTGGSLGVRRRPVVSGTGGRVGSSGTLITVLAAAGPHPPLRGGPPEWSRASDAAHELNPLPAWPRRTNPTEGDRQMSSSPHPDHQPRRLQDARRRAPRRPRHANAARRQRDSTVDLPQTCRRPAGNLPARIGGEWAVVVAVVVHRRRGTVGADRARRPRGVARRHPTRRSDRW